MEPSALDFLQALLETPGPSGYEQPVQEVVRAYARPFSDEVSTDCHGNVVLSLNPQAKRRLLLEESLGAVTEILLDDIVEKGEYLFGKGRTPHFRNVLIPGEGKRVGDFVSVRLRDLRNFTYLADEI